MLVVKDKQKLLMNLNDPAKILALVPGARQVTMKGNQIVSVPHTNDTVRVLRNIGLKAPGPIRSYYDWPCAFDAPFIHQLETAEFSSLAPRAYILNDMGSGKTASALWAADFLLKAGEIDSVVVVSPLSTLERAWGDEVFRHFPDLTCAVVHGDVKKRLKGIASGAKVLVTNHDGFQNKTVLDAFLALPGQVLVIIDELAVFRNASTARWKALNLLTNGNKKLGAPPKVWVWGLTGTPTPNEPTDAWAQCRLITPASVPGFFGAFRDQVMKQISQYKWSARTTALETVHRVMQPAIRFSREDCIDLPPTTYVTREVELTREQHTMYNDMVSKFKAEFAGGQITAMNEAIKIGKLLQIVCGVAYGPDGDLTIPAKPRTDAVLELIDQASAKVIVFVPLTGALNALAEAVGAHYPVAVVHGGVSKTQRDRIFSEFQAPGGPRVIVAQPGTMAHGLTLTAADTIIWYAPVHSAEIYQQANARIVRPGQTRNTLIVRVQGSVLERKMYAKLETRGGTQSLLLGLFD